MKTLVFYTKDYAKYLKNIGFCSENEKISGYSIFTIAADKLDLKKLSLILKKIIFEKNPVTKKSNVIRKAIDENFFSDFERFVLTDISGLLNDNVHFNLDGYICFHLNNYKEIIDKTLYFIVKKYLS